MTLNLKVFVILALLAFGAFLMGHQVLAANNGPKPGWGYGDNNHQHTGPPGLSNHP